MKLLKFMTVILSSSYLLSCQTEPVTVQYLTPSITGIVLDKETDQPIAEVYVTYTSNTYTKTDSQGHFNLSGITVESNDIDVWEREFLRGSSINFAKENYVTKSYSSYGLPLANPRKSLKEQQFVNIGSVYLEKKSDKSNGEGEFIEKMTFCQPHESQKEVNCIPKPVITE